MATSDAFETSESFFRRNITLVWIDSSTNNNDELIEQFYDVVDDLNLFHDVPTGLKYLRMIYRERVLVILSTPVEDDVIEEIHQMSFVYAIYLLQSSTKRSWPKVKLIDGETNLVYPLLVQTVRSIREEDISISFLQTDQISSTTDLDRLEPSFMYTKLLKKTLLDIHYDSKSREHFIEYWRQSSRNNAAQLKIIEEFESDYSPETAIIWYTRCSFVYETINQALRELDSDTILMMGFFLRDLHQHLQKLSAERTNSSSIIYRGQGLSMVDFEKLKKTKGGLISFNNFLSTSEDRHVSMSSAESVSFRENHVGILFVITIDENIDSTPFADIRHLSRFPEEKETLFSMHTVCRIGDIESLDSDGKLFQVQLTLTADDDPDLRMLSDCIEKEWTSATGWHRVADLLIRLGRTKQVEEFYQSCLAKTPKNDKWMIYYYGQLGRVKQEQGLYQEAIENYQNASDVAEKHLLPTDYRFSQLYNNIAAAYVQMGDYVQGKYYLEKDISLLEKTFQTDRSSLASSYSNLASIYYNMGDSSTALIYFHKALAIFEKTLIHNHPTLALLYLNIGSVYSKTGDYSKQLIYIEKAKSIYEKILPADHPTLASCYNNISTALQSKGDIKAALVYSKKTVAAFEKILPNHPNLTIIYNNIGSLSTQVKDYETAIFYMSKAISMEENASPPNPTQLFSYYNNMGYLYGETHDYPQALECYQTALSIAENLRPINVHFLGVCYDQIGAVYLAMNQTTEGLPFMEKGLELQETLYPANHFSLATPFNNIAMAYKEIGDYAKALFYSKKALSIVEMILPENSPMLASSYNNLGSIIHSMKEYDQAMVYLEKALSIVKSHVPIDQYELAECYSNIGENYFQMNDYKRALPLFQEAVDICLTLATPTALSVNKMFERIEEMEKRLK